MNEEIKALLESAGISEETATQLQAILSEALTAAKEEGKKEAEDKAEEDSKVLKESHEAAISDLMEKANEYGAFLMEKANDYGNHINTMLSEKVQQYADHAIEDFIAENKERFVQTEEYERMQGAFAYIKEAFERNGFDVREDVHVQDLKSSLEESTEQYERVFEDLTAAREEIDALKRKSILSEATANLADTQKEKVNELLEAVSFDSLEEFQSGIALIVEQAQQVAVVPSPASDELAPLNEEVKRSEKAIDPSVAKYVSRSNLF